MNDSAPVGVFAILLFVLISIAACTDPLPEAPDPEPQVLDEAVATAGQESAVETDDNPDSPVADAPEGLRWSASPARQPWGGVIAASWRLAESNLRSMTRAIQLEADWCAGDPATAELRTRLKREGEAAAFASLLQSPLPETLTWMQTVFSATVTARDVAMTDMPDVRFISRWNLRRWGCVLDDAPAWMRAWGSPELTVSEELVQMLGWRHPQMTPRIERQLSHLYYGGWYDDGKGTVGRIVLVSADPPSARSVETLSHEIVHALQDQTLNWNLHEIYESLETSDQQIAFRWVFEGDSAATELTLADAELSDLAQTIQLGDTSAIGWGATAQARRAREATHWWGLASPYREGADVLAGLRQRHGWRMINGLLREPPDSTEQVLHLDKFSSDEQPLALVGLEALQALVLTPDRWQEPRSDRMGEDWLGSFIHTAARSSERAVAAAAGWGGDQLVLWTARDDPSRKLITWQIAWDTETEHQQGVEGLVAWLVAQSDSEARWARGHRILGWDGATSAVRLVDTAQSAWLVVAAEIELADQVALAIWSLPAQTYWQ